MMCEYGVSRLMTESSMLRARRKATWGNVLTLNENAHLVLISFVCNWGVVSF